MEHCSVTSIVDFTVENPLQAAMIDEAFLNLAEAIVIQAGRDYRKVLGFLEQSPDNEALVNYQKDLEDFFHSEWFRDLCNLDGDSLLHRIQREQKAIGGIA